MEVFYATSNKQQATSNKRFSSLISNQISMLFALMFGIISLVSTQNLKAQTGGYQLKDGKCCTTIVIPYEYTEDKFVDLEITYCLSVTGGLHEMSIADIKIKGNNIDPNDNEEFDMKEIILAATNACGQDMGDKLTAAFEANNLDECLEGIGFTQALTDENGEPTLAECPSTTCMFRIVNVSCWGEWVKVSNDYGYLIWENSPCGTLSGECVEVMLFCRKKDEITGEWVITIEFQPSNNPATCPIGCSAICD